MINRVIKLGIDKLKYITYTANMKLKDLGKHLHAVCFIRKKEQFSEKRSVFDHSNEYVNIV